MCDIIRKDCSFPFSDLSGFTPEGGGYITIHRSGRWDWTTVEGTSVVTYFVDYNGGIPVVDMKYCGDINP